MDSDEDEDEEDEKGRLTETGKAVKKALRKLEKNKVYGSDDEKDPYASVSLFFYFLLYMQPCLYQTCWISVSY